MDRSDRVSVVERVVRQGVLAACGLLGVLAGGCSEGVIEIKDPLQFQLIAVESPRPVMVMFYKAGCLACAKLQPTLNELAKEYSGRVTFGNFMILDMLFQPTSPDLYARYQIQSVPHVVLLVNGQEKGHWLLDYNIESYRKALNEVLAPPPPPSQPSPPPTQPVSPPPPAVPQS